jgi:uncharacterized delta-60 repeat protein
MPTRTRNLAIFLVTFLALVAMASPAAGAPPLRPDPSFGKRGVVEPELPPHYDYTSFRAVSVAPDGSILAARHDGGDGEDFFTNRRYDPAGNLDPGFEPEANSPRKEVVDVDGKILRASSNAVTRYNPDGSQDLTYGVDPANGRPFSDIVNFQIEKLLLTPSRKLLMAGTILEHDRGKESVEQIVVARFDSQGHLDPGFGGDGLVKLDTEAGVAGKGFIDIEARGEEGAIVLVNQEPLLDYEGQRALPGGSAVVALATDGRPDPGYGSGGVVRSESSIEDFAALDDGALVLTGNRWGEEIGREGVRTSDLYAARLTPSGQYDPAFDGDGIAIVGFGGVDLSEAVLARSDGSILIGGSNTEAVDSNCIEYASFCRETPVLARLLPSGALDPGFGDGGRLRLDALSEPFVVLGAGRGVRALAALPGGGVLAGGGSGTVAFIAALTESGALVPGFGNGGIVVERDARTAETHPHAVGIDSRRRILIAGSTDANALYSNESGAVIRLRPGGSLDPGYAAGAGYVRVPGNTREIAVGAEGDAFVLSGEFAPNLVVHVTPDGALDKRFGKNGVATLPELPPVPRNGKLRGRSFDPRSIAALPDGGVLVGGEAGGFSEARIVLVRFDRRGHLLERFGDGGVAILALGRTGECNLAQLELRRDGRILIAGRVREKGRRGRRPALFQLLADASPDPSFGRKGVVKVNLRNEGIASGLAIMGDGSVLLGGRQSIPRGWKPFLLRFGRKGGLDRGFARRMRATIPSSRSDGGLAPRQILPTAEAIVTVSRYRPALAFSRRGTFRASIAFFSDPKPPRPILTGAVQAGRPLLVGQIGRGRGLLLRRYLTG